MQDSTTYLSLAEACLVLLPELCCSLMLSRFSYPHVCDLALIVLQVWMFLARVLCMSVGRHVHISCGSHLQALVPQMLLFRLPFNDDVCNKALTERLYLGPSLQKKSNIYKGIQCSSDLFPEKGGRSVASIVLMKVITYCLFLLTAFSQLTTCRNCISSCTAFFFLFSFAVFQSNTASNRPEELHLISCVVDRSCVPFMVLLIAVLCEVLHQHRCCFSWGLYLLAAFVYSALPHLQRMCFLWMPYYLFFCVLDLPWMTLPTLSLVLALFFFNDIQEWSCPLLHLWAVSTVQPSSLFVFVSFHQLCSAF